MDSGDRGLRRRQVLNASIVTGLGSVLAGCNNSNDTLEESQPSGDDEAEDEEGGDDDRDGGENGDDDQDGGDDDQGGGENGDGDQDGGDDDQDGGENGDGDQGEGGSETEDGDGSGDDDSNEDGDDADEENEFDLEAARDATAEAIHGTTFEVFGHVTEFQDPGASTPSNSRSKVARGDVDVETARHVEGQSDEIALDGDPRDANRFTDRFYRDETVTERRAAEDVDYDREDAQYRDFADRVETDLDYYYETGTLFEFDDPVWDSERGVYVVEGTGLKDEEELRELEIEECTVHLDSEGVVVGISAELIFEDGTTIRTDVDGETGVDLTVEEPDWIDDAEDEFPAWTYRAGRNPSTTDGDTVLYVSSDNGVAAVDRFDGSEVWAFDVSAGRTRHVVVDGAVYLEGDDEGVYAVDLENGSELWSHEVETRLAYPHVSGETVFFLGLDHVRAYAVADGSHQWTRSANDESWSGRFVGEESVYVGDTDGWLTALDAESGEEQWVFDPPTNYWVRANVVDDGAVYASGFEGDVYRINGADGSETWNVSTVDMVTSVALHAGVLYVCNRPGQVYALDPATGSTRWESAAGEHASVYPRGDAVYVSGDDGVLRRLAADDGSRQWAFEADGAVGEPTFTDDAIYLGTGDNFLTVLDPVDGSVLWRREIGSFVDQAPIVGEELLYVTTSGTVSAFERR